MFSLLLRLSGMSAWFAHGLVDQFADVVRTGRDGGGVLSDAVRQLTGGPPRSFRQWAADNRAAFVRA